MSALNEQVKTRETQLAGRLKTSESALAALEGGDDGDVDSSSRRAPTSPPSTLAIKGKVELLEQMAPPSAPARGDRVTGRAATARRGRIKRETDTDRGCECRRGATRAGTRSARMAAGRRAGSGPGRAWTRGVLPGTGGSGTTRDVTQT